MNTETFKALGPDEQKAALNQIVDQYKAATTKAEKIKLAGIYTNLTIAFSSATRTQYRYEQDPKPAPAPDPEPQPEPTPAPAPVEPAPVRGELRKPKSLTVAECEDIFNRVKAGENRKAIAAQFNVHETTIKYIVGGRLENARHLVAKENI
jgi:DNA-binding NarL/FixJ family response regulator